MCGCYQRRSDKQRIIEAFRVGNVEDLFLGLAPTYNAAPPSMQPIIISDPTGETRMLQMMFWRFLPPRLLIRGRSGWTPFSQQEKVCSKATFGVPHGRQCLEQ